ncbi:hypothetical protein JW998_11460, partial [candidate division KSB1 bacterium]|nr:hypothetical protein [candidate division KSB1 bacterium]
MRALLIILITLSAGMATTFYVDPVAGNINNAGDLHHPWDTLEEVFRQRKALSGGDSLLLLNGHHGAPVIRGNNSLFITISAYKDHRPSCRSVTFDAATKWKLAEVIISPEAAPEYAKTTLVKINRNAAEIIVENCIAYSVLDSSPWTQKDWVDKSCSGASIEGSNNTIRHCHFLNVKHGILVES